MTTIKGDLLDIAEGIICHQVNCQRVAGAGLALQIRNKWPEWYKQFRFNQPFLGSVWLYRPSNSCAHTSLVIASFYAQDGYGHGLQTDYNAFESCLRELKQMNLTQRVYFPSGVGAGLAGGDSEIIHSLIEKYFPNAIIVEKDR